MIKFIFKITLFILLLGISFMYLFNKRPQVIPDHFNSIDTYFDIINLGTSHGGGINYASIRNDSVKCEGFERQGNTLYYDFQNYKFLKTHLEPGAIIIIPLSYFSFGLDENRTDYGKPSPFANDYYYYLPSEAIYDYSFERRISVFLNSVKLNFESIFNDRFPQPPQKSRSLSIREHVDFAIKKHQKMGEYSSPEKNIIYLSMMLEDILKNGYKPVLITTPYYIEYTQGFGDDWLEKHYYDHLAIILKTYKIPYFNYSMDARIVTEEKYFFNSDHLNGKGSSVFSEILFSDMEKTGILKLPKNYH